MSDIKNIGEWLNKPIENIEFYYSIEPINMFITTIKEMESTYDEFPREMSRTQKIVNLIKVGKKPKAIFIELNDPDKFIMEGRHRIVAFHWLGITEVPVLYVK